MEFLSLQNNNISNLNFIKHLPNLWYLDVRKNPIEKFEILNLKNVFGFLGITIDKYCEKSLIQVKNLYLGILYANLSENYKQHFLTNNPNIIQLNDEINLFLDKLVKKDTNTYIKKNTDSKLNFI